MPIVNQAKYASMRGVTAQRIGELVRNGKLAAAVTERKSGQMMIDSDKADELWESNMSKKARPKVFKPKAKPIPPPEVVAEQIETIKKAKINKEDETVTNTYSYYQKMHMAYSAALKKIELEEKQGLLIRREEVMQNLTAVHVAARNKIMGIHDKIGQMLGADAAKIAKDIIWQTLEDLSETKI
jgi:hypothetical protein